MIAAFTKATIAFYFHRMIATLERAIIPVSSFFLNIDNMRGGQQQYNVTIYNIKVWYVLKEFFLAGEGRGA